SRGFQSGSASHCIRRLPTACPAPAAPPVPDPGSGAPWEDEQVRPIRPLDRVAGAHDAAVLAVARRGEPVSRAGLADALQVTPQAISKILARLIDRGLMAEAGTISSGPGQPTTLYSIVPSSRRAVGLHLTRTRGHGVVTDLTGRVLERLDRKSTR